MKTNKGKVFGILLPIVIVLVIAVIVVSASRVPGRNRITAGEVIGVEFSEIHRIRVSAEVYYLDDWDSALWTTVTDGADMEAIYNAISETVVEKGDGVDDALAGGSPRFVTYILKNGEQVEFRFMDDQQLWTDSETCYRFKEKFALYGKIDDVLAGYDYVTAPGLESAGQWDYTAYLVYGGEKYRNTDGQVENLPEGYTALGSTHETEIWNQWDGTELWATFEGEVYGKAGETSLYATIPWEQGLYIEFVPEDMWSAG